MCAPNRLRRRFGKAKVLTRLDTVLAFLPSKAFPAGAKIVMTVGVGATSKAGVPLDKLTSAHATVLKAAKKATGGGGGT